MVGELVDMYIYIYTWQERIVQLFENNTYSVVNIFDVTLRPQLNATGAVEVIFFLGIYDSFLVFFSSI